MTTDLHCVQPQQPDKLARHERRTAIVVALTAVMMVIELVVGWWSRSLALMADGWHMATHVGALGLSLVGYWYARTRVHSRTFSFGTGKVHALAGYTSAGLLGLAAFVVIAESLQRFVRPVAVDTGEALPVAVVGLLFNLFCAYLLHVDEPHHHHHDGHEHTHDHHHHDHNLRAARLHVLADALTSIMAIAALAMGHWLNAPWADPLAALIGGAVILRWGWQLARSCALHLLDAQWSPATAERVRSSLEETGARVVDLHLWELGPGQRGCIVALRTDQPLPLAAYRERIEGVCRFAHVTVEVEATP